MSAKRNRASSTVTTSISKSILKAVTVPSTMNVSWHLGVVVECFRRLLEVFGGCWVLLGVVGWCWVVLLGVVGCCWVLLGVVGCCCWVLLLGVVVGCCLGVVVGCCLRVALK